MEVMAELTARFEQRVAIPGESASTGSRVDRAHFEQVVCAHQKTVFRIILHIVRDADQAASLTQDCFLRAYERISTFRGESSLKTWLSRIAVHLALDHLKSRRAGFWRRLLRIDSRAAPASLPASADKVAPRRETAEAGDSLSPERKLLAQEALHQVKRAVERLSPQQRAVFVLRFFEDYSLEEIRGVTGLRVGTIKSHLFRAVRHIRRSMEGRHERKTVRKSTPDR
jgi:RNA polymerase sigma-70 factor (ECF subfamily)